MALADGAGAHRSTLALPRSWGGGRKRSPSAGPPSTWRQRCCARRATTSPLIFGCWASSPSSCSWAGELPPPAGSADPLQRGPHLPAPHRPPFHSADPQQIYSRILDGIFSFPAFLGDAACSLIGKLCRCGGLGVPRAGGRHLGVSGASLHPAVHGGGAPAVRIGGLPGTSSHPPRRAPPGPVPPAGAVRGSAWGTRPAASGASRGTGEGRGAGTARPLAPPAAPPPQVVRGAEVAEALAAAAGGTDPAARQGGEGGPGGLVWALLGGTTGRLSPHIPQGPPYTNFKRFSVDWTPAEDEFSGWDADF